MQSDATAAAGHDRSPPSLLIVLVLSGLVMLLVWPLVSIQLRLSRNGAISRQLVQSLQAQFPGVSFSGAASYEREVIYILVAGQIDEPTRRDVEQWLRGCKTEQRILPEIWLRFDDDCDDSSTIKI